MHHTMTAYMEAYIRKQSARCK